ncbi:CheY-like chemotaxis protein [Mucilaginibacter frigoritolerans]|uniref:CheY-like chemotaxis protein n=1 Tax=Mucilaginibacter frigoritolerans TaxID=652788 RepID=A0A562U1F1_9SPHI|nr:response regulator [Mucilaginibacter frigoritolerans]TWI99388.1 CheY-like chemotaxis protein [Mucilaginibacter frigoritolerans]
MCKLVVIDDNPTDHYIMQRLLHNNCHCEQATYTFDGRLVLDYLEENKEKGTLPDVIFLDLDMPQLTGWEFLDELEVFNATSQKTVQVHIMSSSIRSADVFHSKKYACVNSFMTKPLNRELINKICEEASANADGYKNCLI